MKKTLTLLALASCLSSYGQGFLIFNNSAATSVKDNFSGFATGVTNSPGTVTAVILYHSGSGFTLGGLGNAASTSSAVGDWSFLTTALSGGWSIATNSTSGNILSANTRIPAPTTGTFSGGTLGINGTAPGDVISMYVIGYQSSFGNIFLASQGSAALGWSNPLNYTLGSSGSPGVAMNNAGMTSFTVSPVPEPATFAVAGLGVAAMLIARRRKA